MEKKKIQLFIAQRYSSFSCEYFMWQRGGNQPCDCVGVLVGFQVVWLINAMKTEPLMRHFLVVVCVICHQGQTRPSNWRVHAVMRRLLCSYLRPGHRRSSQWQYHDQGNWAGIDAGPMSLPSKCTSEVKQILFAFLFYFFKLLVYQDDLAKNRKTNKTHFNLRNFLSSSSSTLTLAISWATSSANLESTGSACLSSWRMTLSTWSSKDGPATARSLRGKTS